MDEFSTRRLRNVISALAEQRSIANSMGDSFAGDLINLAIMQISLTLHEISEDELSVFTDILSLELVDREQMN